MSALVGYGSSDEEDDIQAEKPAKVAKLDGESLQRANEVVGAQTQLADQDYAQEPASAPYAPVVPPQDQDADPLGPPPGPSAAPSVPSVEEPIATPSSDEPPSSPYTTERLRLRDLTMSPIPNFDIPDAPPPPLTNSEEAATLAATTKKFERFLELKKQGVHFNERLQNSSSLRNPSLLPKLMEFAGISQEESYASTLELEEGGVPVRWAEECYVESLVKASEKREKKRLAEREKVDFVPPKSTDSSAATTPAGGGGARRSKFDRR